MKLLHQEPLVFAKEVISIGNDTAEVFCEFEQLPTIGMFIEAAAQATAAFFQKIDIQSGYLAQANNIELIDKVTEKSYVIELKLEIKFDSMSKYSFIVKNNLDKKLMCKGEVTISVE